MNSLSKLLLCLLGFLGLLLPLCLSAQTPQIPQQRAYVANLPAGGRWYAVTNLDLNALDARIASVAGTSAANSPAPSNDFDYVSYNGGWRKLADSPIVSFDSILEANGSATSRTFSVQSGTFADSVTVGSSSLSQAGMNALTITAPYGITGIPDPRGGSSPVPYSMLLGTNALMALSVQDARAAAFAQSQFLSNEVVRVETAATLAADLTYPIATNALTQATKALVFSGAVSNQLATHKANGAADHIDLATRTYVDNSIAGAMVPVESAAAAYIMATNALNTATNATLVANDAKTISTNAILVANDAKALAIAATNLINVANMPSATWKGTNSVSIGTGSRATAAGTFALGYLAYADDARTFVFNGSGSTNAYASHGIGTFNVNPTTGANGFYVGEATLTQVIDDRVAPYTRPSTLYNAYYDITYTMTATHPWRLETVESPISGTIGFPIAVSNFTDAAGAPVPIQFIYQFEEPRYNYVYVGPWYPGNTNSYVMIQIFYPGVTPNTIYAISIEPVASGTFGPTTLAFTNDWTTSGSAEYPVYFRADVTAASSVTRSFDLSLIAPAHLAATNALDLAQQALASSGGLVTNDVNDLSTVIVSNHNLSASAHEDIRASVSNAVDLATGAVKTNSVGGLAIGGGAVASGTSSFSIGTGTTASGVNSFSGGHFSESSGYACFSFGDHPRAMGEFSIALGNNSTASHDYSFVWSGYNGISSHGSGTFTIDPLHGPSGFYIGETNLQTFLDLRLSVSDFASSNATTSARIDGLAVSNAVNANYISALEGSNAANFVLSSYLYQSNAVNVAAIDTKPSAESVTNAVFYKPLTNFYSDTTTTVAVTSAMKIYRVYVTNSTTLVFDTSALDVTNQAAPFEVWVTQESTNTSVTWPSTNTLRYTTLPTAITADGQTTQAALRKWYDVFLTNEVTECNVYQVR